MSAGVETGSAEAMHAALARLSGMVDEGRAVAGLLSPEEIWTCSDATVEAMLRVHAQLESLTAALGHLIVRDADVRGLAGKDGKASTASWLAAKLTLLPGEAAARVKTAEMLSRAATATAAALVAGRVNADQARAIARGLGKLEARGAADRHVGVVGEAEAFLLREGVGLHAGHITRLSRYIGEVLDPDGPEPKEKARRSRDLSISDLGGGRHRISGELTDECAALVKAALDPLAAPRPAVDGVKDARSAGQRRHDALQAMTEQYLRHGQTATAHGVRPHLQITASIETLKGDTGHPFARTATGEDLDIPTLQRLACDAGMTGILTDSFGVPLAMGRAVRTVTPAQWKALVVRDIGCIGEGCTRPASWCQAHHFPEWDHGGATDIDKLALLCSHEHYLVHHEGWEVRLGADGHPEMIPPPWVDPQQRSRRNAHWKLLRDGLKTDPARGP